MKTEPIENTKESNQGEAESKLTVREQRFVEAMVDPEIKSQSEAALVAGYSPKNARRIASENLTKLDIRKAIEIRKKELAQYANIQKESIIGAAALTAFGTIDDAFDESGHFDIQKARKTGAIHLIKSIKRTPNKYGESVSVEFYSAADARRELAEYLGIKQMPRENEENLRRAVDSIVTYLELNPDYELERAVIIFAKARSIDRDLLREKVIEAMEMIH